MFSANVYSQASEYEDRAAKLARLKADNLRHLFPAFSPQWPWIRNGSLEQDLVIVTEFSELEGPKPLVVIPQAGCGNFDVNLFAVKIMSVDHQPPKNGFTLMEDKQVLISEMAEGVSAYVHYFILYDLQARGYVRPFCMAFVTPDTKKLTSFFQEISEQFSKASRDFKLGNLKLFIQDLSRQLKDLNHTKDNFPSMLDGLCCSNLDCDAVMGSLDVNGDKRQSKVDDICSLTLQSIENSIRETKDILRALHPYLDEISESDLQFDKQDQKIGVDKEPVIDGNSEIVQKSELSENVADSECESPPVLCLDLQNYKPKVYQPPSRKRFEFTLRNLAVLCLKEADLACNQLERIQQHFSRDLAILEMLRMESLLAEPSTSLLTVGGCITNNFLHGLDRDSPGIEDKDFDWILPLIQLKKTNSDETLFSYKSSSSCYSFKDEDVLHLPRRLGNNGSDRRGSDTASIGTSEDTCLSEGASEDLCSRHFACETLPTSSSLGSRFSADDGIQSFSSFLSSSLSRNMKKSWCLMADVVDSKELAAEGLKLINVIDHCPHLDKVVASILSGRFVAVIGDGRYEEEVKTYVKALSLFIPGYLRSASDSVVFWQKKPLHLTDLAQLQIAGLHRPNKRRLDYMIPSSIRGYITILDVEKQNIIAPMYQGEFITTMLSKIKVFRSKESYLAYLYSILQEMSAKAFLYYHSFCLNLGNSSANLTQSFSNMKRQAKVYKDTSAQFLKNYNMREDDRKIIRFLARLIFQQQLQDHHDKLFSEKDLPVKSISISYEKQYVWAY